MLSSWHPSLGSIFWQVVCIGILVFLLQLRFPLSCSLLPRESSSFIIHFQYFFLVWDLHPLSTVARGYSSNTSLWATFFKVWSGSWALGRLCFLAHVDLALLLLEHFLWNFSLDFGLLSLVSISKFHFICKVSLPLLSLQVIQNCLSICLVVVNMIALIKSVVGIWCRKQFILFIHVGQVWVNFDFLFHCLDIYIIITALTVTQVVVVGRYRSFIGAHLSHSNLIGHVELTFRINCEVLLQVSATFNYKIIDFLVHWTIETVGW